MNLLRSFPELPPESLDRILQHLLLLEDSANYADNMGKLSARIALSPRWLGLLGSFLNSLDKSAQGQVEVVMGTFTAVLLDAGYREGLRQKREEEAIDQLIQVKESGRVQ